MAVQDTLETLLSQLKHIAKTETVFGEPIVTGEITIIPVSKISFGFAAGGGGKNESKTGTGGGIQITPIALISIKGEKVTVHPMEKESSDFSKLLGLAPDLIEKIIKTTSKDKKEK
jgi:uncharacterized spore protein YtfJ